MEKSPGEPRSALPGQQHPQEKPNPGCWVGGTQSLGCGSSGTEQDRILSVPGINTSNASRARHLLQGWSRHQGILHHHVPGARSSLDRPCPGLSASLGEGKATNGISTAREREKTPSGCLRRGVSPRARELEPLVAVGDEALNQGRALGICCSWKTLGALGGEEQGCPHGPCLEAGEGGNRCPGQTHSGTGPGVGVEIGFRGLTKRPGGRM